MEPKTTLVSFIKVPPLNIEEIEEIYIYKDNNTSKYSIFYNEELPLKINLEKSFWKKYKKVKNYFDYLEDIKVNYIPEKEVIQITYFLKEKYYF